MIIKTGERVTFYDDCNFPLEGMVDSYDAASNTYQVIAYGEWETVPADKIKNELGREPFTSQFNRYDMDLRGDT